MTTKLSICVPLYNKFFALERVLASISSVLENQGALDWEVVITNNGSTDSTPEQINEVCRKFQKVSVVHLERTISLPENWMLAMNLATGDIIKLQLADDEFGTPDLRLIEAAFTDPAIDYVVLRTQVEFSEEIPQEQLTELATYFEEVNHFRTQIRVCSERQKIDLLVASGIIKGRNLFGDINALYFRRSRLNLVTKPIRSGDAAVKSWPDLEIYFRLYINTAGCFLQAGAAKFQINETSTCFAAESNPEVFRQMYSRLGLMFVFDLLLNTDYSALRPKFPLSARFGMAMLLAKVLLKFLIFPARR